MSAVACFTLCLTLAAAPADDDGAKPMDELRWLLGAWVHQGEKTVIRETWTNADGVFVGAGVTLSKDESRVLQRESMLLADMSGEV
ncbi:MAG: hypothetical protein AAF907_13895, partial [Planctomycetota bacterium]